MLQTVQLSFGYSETEDRILFRAAGRDGQVLSLLLTRRITRRLLAGFTDILARSSALLRKVAADDRMEVMVLEHLGAVSGLKRTPAASATSSPPPSTPARPQEGVLATQVHVQTLPDHFNLQIDAAAGPQAAARLSRAEFHQLLSVLDHFAEKAEWNLKGETGWLTQTEQVLRGKSPAEAS